MEIWQWFAPGDRMCCCRLAVKRYVSTAKYITSTIGKKRGYTTRIENEVTGKDGAPLAPLTVCISPEIYDEKNDGKPAGEH